mgnify:FL=1
MSRQYRNQRGGRQWRVGNNSTNNNKNGGGSGFIFRNRGQNQNQRSRDFGEREQRFLQATIEALQVLDDEDLDDSPKD